MPTVRIGWAMVRDVANMFFVVVLLAIAFGTILGVEQYQWNKTLVKMILAAIFVNFSNLICGIIIDIAHVFTITFLNAISATAGGNLINMFSLDQVHSMVTGEKAGTGDFAIEVLLATIVALGFSVLVAVVMGAYALVMLLRMVVLWVLIILSPLAFAFQALEKTKTYASEWWKEFGNHVLVAPIMVFFLWLTFATLGAGNVIEDLKVAGGDNGFKIEAIGEEENLGGGGTAEEGKAATHVSLSAVTSWTNMAGFLIPLAMMVVGLRRVQQLGVEGGEVLSKAKSFAGDVAKIATGYALGRKLVGGAAKGAAAAGKGAAWYAPGIGGEKWSRGFKREWEAVKGKYYGYAISPTERGREIIGELGEKRGELAKTKDPGRKEELEKEITGLEDELSTQKASGLGRVLGWAAARDVKGQKALAKTESQTETRREIAWKRAGAVSGGSFVGMTSDVNKGLVGRKLAELGQNLGLGEKMVMDSDRVERGWLAGEKARSAAKDKEFETKGELQIMSAPRYKDGRWQIENDTMQDMITRHELGASQYSNGIEIGKSQARLDIIANYKEDQGQRQEKISILQADIDALAESYEERDKVNLGTEEMKQFLKEINKKEARIERMKDEYNEDEDRENDWAEADKIDALQDEIEKDYEIFNKSVVGKEDRLEWLNTQTPSKGNEDAYEAEKKGLQEEIREQRAAEDKRARLLDTFGAEGLLEAIEEKEGQMEEIKKQTLTTMSGVSYDDYLDSQAMSKLAKDQLEGEEKDYAEARLSQKTAYGTDIDMLAGSLENGFYGSEEERAKIEVKKKEVEKRQAAFDGLRDRNKQSSINMENIRKELSDKEAELEEAPEADKPKVQKQIVKLENKFDEEQKSISERQERIVEKAGDLETAKKDLQVSQGQWSSDADALRNGDITVAKKYGDLARQRAKEAKNKGDEEEEKRYLAEGGIWDESVGKIQSGGSSAWAYGAAKAREKETSRLYRYQHNLLLSEAEQRVVWDKRGIDTPKTSLIELVEEAEKDFSQMSYDQFMSNSAKALLEISKKHKDPKKYGKVTDADRAALIGLFKRGFNESWVDDVIIGVMNNTEAKQIIGDAVGWHDAGFTPDKVGDVEMLMATGADIDFVKKNVVVREIKDEAVQEMNMTVAGVYDGMRTGTFKDKEGKEINKDEFKEAIRKYMAKKRRVFTKEQDEIFESLLTTSQGLEESAMKQAFESWDTTPQANWSGADRMVAKVGGISSGMGMNLDFDNSIKTGKFVDRDGKAIGASSLARLKSKVAKELERDKVELNEAEKKLFNGLFDDQVAMSERNRKNFVDDYLNVTRKNQSAFQFFGNIRNEAIAKDHGENAGWTLHHDVGNGETLYDASGTRMARDHVYYDVNKTDTRRRGAAHPHMMIDLGVSDEYGQIAMGLREEEDKVMRGDITDANDFRSTTSRTIQFYMGLSSGDKLSDQKVGDKFSVGKAKSGHKLWEQKNAMLHKQMVDKRKWTNADGNQVSLENETDQTKIEEAVAAQNILKRLYVPKMKANMLDFAMLAANASGITPHEALRSGKINMQIPYVNPATNKVDYFDASNMDKLIKGLNGGVFGFKTNLPDFPKQQVGPAEDDEDLGRK